VTRAIFVAWPSTRALAATTLLCGEAGVLGRANGLGVAERFLDGVPSGLSALMATALMATSLLGATMGVSKPDAYAVDRDVRRDDLVFIGR
jgi:hypothetical protein